MLLTFLKAVVGFGVWAATVYTFNLNPIMALIGCVMIAYLITPPMEDDDEDLYEGW